MKAIIEWLVNELCSVIFGEGLGVLREAHDNKQRRNQLEKALTTIVESEQGNDYYEALYSVLTNSQLIHDCLSSYESIMPEHHLDERISDTLSRFHIPIEKAQCVSGVLKKMINCAHEIMLKPASSEERRNAYRLKEVADSLSAEHDRILEEIIDLKRLRSRNQPPRRDYLSYSENVKNPSVYIKRFLIGAEEKTDDIVALRIDPMDVLDSMNRIIIVNDAGFGKTCTLKQIHQEAQAKGYLSIFQSLKNYPGLPILNKLCDEEVDINQNMLLVLDGYDEMGVDHFKSFEKLICDVIERNPRIRIVMSSRENFYRDHHLESFKKTRVADLTNEDREQYLRDLGVDVGEFFNQVGRNNLFDMCNNVFLFVELVHIWQREGELPSSADVMGKIIDVRIRDDQIKYQVSDPDLFQNTERIRHSFERIAFVMQCMHRQHITKEELKRICDIEKQMEMQGLWIKDESGNWSFAHNNFREYFSAAWLNKLSIDEILRYITFKETNQVKHSWVNVLSYLASIRRQRDLMEWIETNHPQMIVVFEKERLSQNERAHLFIALYEKYELEQRWADISYDARMRMGAFATGNETVKYILNKLTLGTSIRQTKNLLRILEHFDGFYSFEEEGKITVANIAFNDALPAHVRIDAVNVMRAFPQVFDLYVEDAVKRALKSTEIDYRYRLCRFIDATGLLEKHFCVIINEIDYGKKTDEIDIGREMFLEKVATTLQSPECVLMILHYYSDHPEKIEDALFMKFFTRCCKVAEESYSAPDDKFNEMLQKIFIHAQHRYDKQITDTIKEYMIATKTESLFLDLILNSTEIHVLPALEDLMCHSFAAVLLNYYSEGRLPDDKIIKQLMQRISEQNELISLFVRAVFNKTGEIIEVVPSVDYSELRRKGYQMYFDSLFNLTSFTNMIDRIGEMLGFDAIVQEKHHIHSDQPSEKISLQACYYTLRRIAREWGNVTFQSIKELIVKHWDSYCFSLAWRAVEQYGNDIEVRQEQREWLIRQTLIKIGQIDAKSIMEDFFEKNSVSYEVIYPLKALVRFNMECPEELLKPLLLVPTFLWHESYYGRFHEYLLTHIPKEELEKQVLYNIAHLKLKGCVAAAHIDYCEQNHLPECKDLAMEFLRYAESDGDRYEALKYLKNIFGVNLIINEILPECNDNNLLRAIAHHIPFAISVPTLDAKLMEAYQKTANLSYLQELLYRNNREALEQYYDIAEKEGKIPDISVDGGVPSITEAIRAVSDIALVDIILKLLHLVYKPGFRDIAFWGLRDSCLTAIKNMAERHYKEVLDLLKNERESPQESYRLTCIDLIDTISEDHWIQCDVGMSFETAVALTTRI